MLLDSIQLLIFEFYLIEFILAFKNQGIYHYNNIHQKNQKYERVFVKVGQKAVLPCFIDKLDSYYVIWIKNGDILSLGSSKINSDNRLNIQHRYLNEWNLIIENVSTDDKGEYSCKTNGNYLKTIHLEVLVSPNFDDFLSTSAGDINVNEGSQTSLKCFANANPEPIIKWFRWKKYQHFKTQKQELNYTGNIIVIPAIHRNDPNIYECIAKNTIPPASSRIFSLIIHFLPEVSLEIHKQSQLLYKRISLECEFQSNPIDNVSWFKDGILFDLNLNNNRRKNDLNNFTTNTIIPDAKYEKYDVSNEKHLFKFVYNLTATIKNKNGFGKYECCVENNLGKACSSKFVTENYKKFRYENPEKIIYKDEDNMTIMNKHYQITTGFYLDSKDKRRHFLIKANQFVKFNQSVFNSYFKLKPNQLFIYFFLIFNTIFENEIL